MNTRRITTVLKHAVLLAVILVSLQSQTHAAATIFNENFNGITGTFPATQFQSGNDLDVNQLLDEWARAGAGTIHAVDHDGAGNLAPMLWGGNNVGEANILTLSSSIPGSNVLGRTYDVDFRSSPSVYALGAQASTAAEGVLVEVFNGGGVVGSYTSLPGAWAGNMAFVADSFSYVGDGTGDIQVRVSPSNPGVGRFGSAIDDLQLSDQSLANVTLLADARADYQAAAVNGDTADFNGGEGISDTEGSGRWNYLDGTGGSLLTFGSAGNAGNNLYGGTEANSLPALGDQQIFGNVSGPAPDEIQWHAGDNNDAVMRWTAGADVTDLLIAGEIVNRASGSMQFDIFVNGINQFSVDLGSLAFFNLNGLSIDAGQHVEFVLSDNLNGIGGDLADLKATISGNIAASATASAPEPSSFALAALSLLGLVGYRRRRSR